MQLAERYKAKPADNLTTILLRGEVDGENLNELEFCSFFLLLCIAGNETTRTVTTNGWKLLLDHPDQLELLVREPARIPDAVEEILRFDPAVHYFRRTATQDTEIRGRRIRKGDKVVMWYPSANRDEDVFAEPDRFDVTRADNEHLAFGIGEHYCLGANLARLELNVIFEELVARLRRPRLLAPAAPPALELHQRGEGDADRLRAGAGARLGRARLARAGSEQGSSPRGRVRGRGPALGRKAEGTACEGRRAGSRLAAGGGRAGESSGLGGGARGGSSLAAAGGGRRPRRGRPASLRSGRDGAGRRGPRLGSRSSRTGRSP